MRMTGRRPIPLPHPLGCRDPEGSVDADDRPEAYPTSPSARLPRPRGLTPIGWPPALAANDRRAAFNFANMAAMTTRILITGGAGNIGGSLARRLVDREDTEVTVVDNLMTGSIAKMPTGSANFRFINANVNDAADISPVMTAGRFDYVFHYAALVGVQRTLAQPVAVLRDVDGIRNVLSLCKNTGVRRVFYASSSEVYGEPVHLPQHEETTPLNSRLPYAIVKNVGESFCRAYHQEFGLSYNVFRFFNTYGPHQTTDFVIPRFLAAAVAGEDLKIYGDGSQTRTFCHVEDNLDATIAVLDDPSCADETINIGSDVETTVRQLAELIIELTASGSSIVHLPPLPEGDMTRRRPDITRMRALLGREPRSLEQGLRSMLGTPGGAGRQRNLAAAKNATTR